MTTSAQDKTTITQLYCDGEGGRCVNETHSTWIPNARNLTNSERQMKSEHLLGQEFQTTSFAQISKYLHLCEEAIWKVVYYHVHLI